jgi:hypothetical protein
MRSRARTFTVVYRAPAGAFPINGCRPAPATNAAVRTHSRTLTAAALPGRDGKRWLQTLEHGGEILLVGQRISLWCENPSGATTVTCRRRSAAGSSNTTRRHRNQVGGWDIDAVAASGQKRDHQTCRDSCGGRGNSVASNLGLGPRRHCRASRPEFPWAAISATHHAADRNPILGARHAGACRSGARGCGA